VDSSLLRTKSTSFVDEVVVSYGIVVNNLVPCRQNKNLFLLPDSFSLCYQYLDIGQGFASRVLPCFVAQSNSPTLLNASDGRFYRYPFHGWVSHEVNFIDRRPIFLAVAHLKVQPVRQVDDLVEVFGLFRNLCEQFKTRNPFLF
jgi:hypothetical protein